MFNVQLPWKQIGYGMLMALIIGIFYYYVSYIPNKLEQEQIKNKILQEDAKTNEATIKLRQNSQESKERVNERVFAQISTNHSKPMPNRSIVVPSRRVR